jgi:hypothetical protein
MNDGESADQGSPGVVSSDGRPARHSWLRRIGLALLAIVWMAWFVIGGVFEFAGSMAMGDHSTPSYQTATLLLTIIWIVPLVVIGAIIWLVSRSPQR